MRLAASSFGFEHFYGGPHELDEICGASTWIRYDVIQKDMFNPVLHAASDHRDPQPLDGQRRAEGIVLIYTPSIDPTCIQPHVLALSRTVPT